MKTRKSVTGRTRPDSRTSRSGSAKRAEVRYLDLHEQERLDEGLLVDWVLQASRLPGWGSA